MNSFNPLQLVKDLDAVFLQFPDLAEDEELRRHVLEHGTDFLPAIKTCLEVMQEAESMMDGIGNRISVLRDRMARMDRKSGAMRNLIQRLMEHAHEHKLTFPEATLSIRQVQPSVVVDDEDILPDFFTRFKREPNKTQIKTSLEAGEFVPGCHLSNGGTTLSVRVK